MPPSATTARRFLEVISKGETQKALKMLERAPLLAKIEHKTNGMRPLSFAAWFNQEAILAALLPVSYVPAIHYAGQNALMSAAQMGALACVKKLLTDPEGAALAQKKDVDGNTAFLLAVRSNHVHCAAALLPVSDPQACAASGVDALMLAAEHQDPTLLRLLLPVISPKNKTGWGLTALLNAAQRGSAACVQELLPLSDWRSEMNPFFGQRQGSTALDAALNAKHWACVDLLASESSLEDAQRALLALEISLEDARRGHLALEAARLRVAQSRGEQKSEPAPQSLPAERDFELPRCQALVERALLKQEMTASAPRLRAKVAKKDAARTVQPEKTVSSRSAKKRL